MKRRKNKRQWTGFLLIFFGFLLLLLSLYGKFLYQRESSAARKPQQSGLRPVKVMTPVASSGSVYAEVLGRVRGKQTVLVRTNVSGWVKRINSARGQEIEKNGIILELRDYRVKTRLDEARHNLESARGNLAEAARVFERNKDLLEKGIVSRDETDASRNAFESAASAVKALEASRNRARWDHGNLKIRSPISGRVVDIVPDVGQETGVGEVVAKVVNLSGRKVIAGADVSVARGVEPGDELEVFLEKDGVRETAAGKVRGVSPGSDDLSGTYDIEIVLSGSSVEWWPGEMVSVRVPVQSLDDVARVPKSAVLSGGGETFVMVEKDGKASKVPVTVTWADDSWGYVPFGSLPPGSRIVVEGSYGLLPGQAVRASE